MSESSPRVTFEFSVWPLETGHWEPSIYRLFRGCESGGGGLVCRVSMDFESMSEWREWSASIERQGFTLREVEQITPHCIYCGVEIDRSKPHSASRSGLWHVGCIPVQVSADA